MLPYKHYAALEIEQVLQKQENPTGPPHECGAEESTLLRWRLEIPPKLSAIAASLELLVNISSINLLPPLQRLYKAASSKLTLVNVANKASSRSLSDIFALFFAAVISVPVSSS